MIKALLVGHTLDNSFVLFHSAHIHLRCVHAAHTRNHIHNRLHVAHLFNLLELFKIILQRELIALKLFLHFEGGFFVHCFLGFFYQGNNITHAKNAGSNSLRMEYFKVFGFFAGTNKEDWLTCDCFKRKSRTTTGIGVKLSKDYTAKSKLFVKALCNINGILTGHGICYEEHFYRISYLFDFYKLGHHFFVNLKTTGSIYNNCVVAVFAGIVD